MPEVRYEESMAAAQAILNLLSQGSCRSDPRCICRVAYLIQEAIYASEARLAEVQPRRLLCLGCFHSLRYQPEHAGRRIKCPYCLKKSRLPDGLNVN